VVATWQSDVCLLSKLLKSSLIGLSWEQYKLAQVLNSNVISEWLC